MADYFDPAPLVVYSSAVARALDLNSYGQTLDVSFDDVNTDVTALGVSVSLKADLNSPALVGIPTAPTAGDGDNTTTLATTEFVRRNTGIGLGHELVWVTKVTTFEANINDALDCDTSGGAWTLTLPASPVDNDIVYIHDCTGSWKDYNLTVDGNGNTIVDVDQFICDKANMTISFRYSTVYGWRVQ